MLNLFIVMEGLFKSFQELIEENTASASDLKLLPICHTTTEGYFISICRSEALEPINDSSVPGENKLYFFYAKPSYIVESEIENITQTPPLTLIFDIEDIIESEIKVMFPFDSGGFKRYMFKKGLRPDNFAHKHPTVVSIKSLIKLLYEDNEAYLKDQISLKKLENLKEECWEIEELHNLYLKIINGNVKTGRQVFSIELQYDSNVILRPKIIVLPYSFTTSKFWSKVLQNSNSFPNIRIEFYAENETLINSSTGFPLSSFEYHKLMRDKVISLINNGE